MLLTIRDGTFIINDNGFKVITQDSHLVSDYLVQESSEDFASDKFSKNINR